MTNISSVGAPAYNYTPAQTQAAYQATPTAATTAYQQADMYQARYQASPVQATQQQEPYSVINKTDMMLGAGGAVAGFFLAGMIGVSGPIGALIVGLVILGLSAGVRGIKHMSQKKQQQQMTQAVHPGFQQQTYQYPQQAYQPQSYQPTSYTPTQQNYQYPQQAQAAVPQQSMQYAQNYQNYGQQRSASGNVWGDSAWEKFLSWL